MKNLLLFVLFIAIFGSCRDIEEIQAKRGMTQNEEILNCTELTRKIEDLESKNSYLRKENKSFEILFDTLALCICDRSEDQSALDKIIINLKLQDIRLKTQSKANKINQSE